MHQRRRSLLTVPRYHQVIWARTKLQGAKMKALIKSVGVTLVVLASSGAGAETSTGYSENLKCRIASLDLHEDTPNGFGSFIPPIVGSVVSIDASQETISELQFEDSSMIPVLEPLRKIRRAITKLSGGFSYSAEQLPHRKKLAGINRWKLQRHSQRNYSIYQYKQFNRNCYDGYSPLGL
jgi:hypothetical protein